MQVAEHVSMEEARRLQMEALRLFHAVRCCGAPLVVLDLDGRPRVESDAWMQAATTDRSLAQALHAVCASPTESEERAPAAAGGAVVRTAILDGRGTPVGYLVRFASDANARPAAGGSTAMQQSFQRVTASASGMLQLRGIALRATCAAGLPDAAADYSSFEERVLDQILEHAAAARSGSLCAELHCDPDPCVDVYFEGEPASTKRVALDVIAPIARAC